MCILSEELKCVLSEELKCVLSEIKVCLKCVFRQQVGMLSFFFLQLIIKKYIVGY